MLCQRTGVASQSNSNRRLRIHLGSVSIELEFDFTYGAAMDSAFIVTQPRRTTYLHFEKVSRIQV